MFLASLMLMGIIKTKTTIIEMKEGITPKPIIKWEVIKAATEKATPKP
jgi:hypothetical protein